MGGDAILHHPGNSTRVDYISRAFRAGHHSKSHIDELYFNCGIMYLPSVLDVEEILQKETILALQGRRLDPISALQQAQDIFDYRGALLPLDNAAFRLVWFTGMERWYHNQVYIWFEYPSPDPLCAHVAWDRSRLLGDLELSKGRFIETEPTIVKLWDFFFVCVSFSI